MSLLDRHIAFLEALRAAGLPVSLAEDLDAVVALGRLHWADREMVREAYAATVCKRQAHRPSFDAVFDLYFPALVGDGRTAASTASDDEAEDDPWSRQARPAEEGPRDTPEQLRALQDELGDALELDDQQMLADLAIRAVGQLGHMPGQGPGRSTWSAYSTLKRLSPEDLVFTIMMGLEQGGMDSDEARAVVARRVDRFRDLVERDARRRIAEVKGADHVADATVRPTVDRLDFLSARSGDVDALRREIMPLARRLATRLTKEQHARRRGPLDFRRTVRASISTGGVPLTTHHKPKRPHRSELVVLCDVSGSVAHFASFTLLLVFALREQFTKVRAFTFVDDVTEVTEHFTPGADPVEVLTRLAEASAHAARFGRTNYGRAFARFAEEHADALGPKTSLLVLGDARSNYADLQLDVVKEIVGQVKHSYWLNPEHHRNWDSGDSAAHEYGTVVPMVECRNLTQLGEFVHDLV
jgi:uncharacterized protein with von Willebrand factor type A (vWA) domain